LEGVFPLPRFDGALLRARRKELGLNVEQVAWLSHLSYGQLNALERNEARPSISSLERLCTALGCNPDSVFAKSDDDGADLRPTDLGRDTDAWVARTLSTAPRLTKRQAERISAALFERATA
jgi:transcriptional regulator with XRE-family HTH domain